MSVQSTIMKLLNLTLIIITFLYPLFLPQPTILLNISVIQICETLPISKIESIYKRYEVYLSIID